ncbi:MAG: hypothetical protein RI947_1230 [Candidatus Parcubacteria bacterium]|jgi:ribosomal protein S18 acetylase RimI-like enzyme
MSIPEGVDTEKEALKNEIIQIEDDEEGWRLGMPVDVIDSPDKIRHIDKVLNQFFTETYPRNFAWTAITHDMLTAPSPELQRLLKDDLEAVASMKGMGIPELDDCYMVCFGRNAPERKAKPGKTEQDLQTAREIFAQPPKQKTPETAKTSELPGFTVTYDRITAATDADIVAQFKALYTQDTPYDDEYLMELMSEKKNIFYAAVRTDPTGKREVVCTGSALSDGWNLRRNGKDFNIAAYEITGARVKPDHAGRGYYQGVLRAVMQTLADGRRHTNLAYGFSNLDQPAVQAAVRNQGRHSMFESADALGLKVKGIRQHSHYFGELTDYNLTYIVGNELREKYGNRRQQLKGATPLPELV